MGLNKKLIKLINKMDSNVDKMKISEIEKFLEDFCLTIADSNARMIMNKRKDTILDVFRNYISISDKFTDRFCLYIKKNGYNPFSLYAIALGVDDLSKNIFDKTNDLEDIGYEYFDKLLDEVSVGSYSSFNKFFYTSEFDELLYYFVKPSFGKYAFEPRCSFQYGANFCLKELFMMLQNQNYLIHYNNRLFKKSDVRMFLNINEALNNLDTNAYLETKIFNEIVNLASHFKGDARSFGLCIRRVLDSDSYYELNSKLKMLRYALYLGQYSNHSGHFYGDLYRNLCSDKHKEIYCGEVVGEENWLDKPKSIIERMKYLYSKIDDSRNYDFLDRINKEARFFSSLCVNSWNVDKEFVEFYKKYFSDINSRISNDAIQGNMAFLGSRKEFIFDSLRDLGLRKNFREKFCSIYDQNKDNYSFINLYLIALAYQSQKDNFENFCAIVDDCNKIIPSYNTTFTSSMHFDYVLLRFMGNKYYKDMPNTRRIFGSLLDTFDGRLSDKYREIVERIDTKSRYYYHDSSKDVVTDRFIYSEILDNELASLYERDGSIFYHKLLTKKRGRVSYINNKLLEIESNPRLRDKIFSRICEWPVELFEELDIKLNRDSFIDCMEKVFDSDTYQELLNKIDFLDKASFLYRINDKNGVLKAIKSLSSLDCKKRVDGVMVSYPTNCMNKTVKPKRIIDRMKDLYSKIDDGLSYDFLDNVHRDAYEFSVIEQAIDEMRIKPLSRFKQKLKSFSINKKD